MSKKISMSERIRRRVLAAPNASASDVAKFLDVSPSRVHLIMWQMRKKGMIPPSTRGRKNAQPTQEQASEIVKMEKPKLVFAATSYTPVTEDPVNHPAHYKVGGIETIDYIEAKLSPTEFAGYLKGNILKYGSRVGHKVDASTDAGKLAWYAARLATLLKKAA